MGDSLTSGVRRGGADVDLSTVDVKSLLEILTARVPGITKENGPEIMRRLGLTGGLGDFDRPQSAPELYEARSNKREHVVDFIRRVYAPWLNGQFTRADLRQIDGKVVAALEKFESRRKQRVPLSELLLPTAWQRGKDAGLFLGAGELS